MASENTFKKIGATDKPMYGPPAILVCGYPAEQHQAVIEFFASQGLTRFSMVFVTQKDEALSLRELLARESLSGQGQTGGSRKAIILSGFTENELRKLLEAFRAGSFKRPLLATLTPTSESWSVHDLLHELAREAEAMKNMRPPHPSGNQE